MDYCGAASYDHLVIMTTFSVPEQIEISLISLLYNLARVGGRLDKAIHWINRCPGDSVVPTLFPWIAIFLLDRAI